MNENLYNKNKHEPIFVVTDENLKNCKTSEDALKRLEKATRGRMKEDVHKYITDLEEENAILKKALRLYVDWADECGIAWDNFPDMTEKWYKTVEEKGLGWIEGLVFMVTEEAKEQLKKEIKGNDI